MWWEGRGGGGGGQTGAYESLLQRSLSLCSLLRLLRAHLYFGAKATPAEPRMAECSQSCHSQMDRSNSAAQPAERRWEVLFLREGESYSEGELRVSRPCSSPLGLVWQSAMRGRVFAVFSAALQSPGQTKSALWLHQQHLLPR